MRIEKFGIRVKDTDRLHFGPDHLRNFGNYPLSCRTWDTVNEAQERADEIAALNIEVNALHAHLTPRDTEFEVVRIVTEVLALEAVKA